MSNTYAAIGIAVAAVALLLGAILVALKARGASMTERRLSMRFYVAFGVAATAALATLWLIFDLSIAILPALMVPVWIPLLTRNEQSPPRPKLLVAALIAGTVSVAVATGIFFLLSD